MAGRPRSTSSPFARDSANFMRRSRRTKNNPVLLGEAGVGKTAIVEGLKGWLKYAEKFTASMTWRFSKDMRDPVDLNPPARSIERNPWLALKQLLITRVVMFDDVIQAKTGSTSAPTPQFLLPLKFRDHFWL